MAKVDYEYWNPDDLRILKENKINHGNTDNQAYKDVYHLNAQNIRSTYGMTDADDISVNQLDQYINLAEQNKQKRALLTNITGNTSVAPAVRQRADAIMNFNYNPDKDPAYKSYVDMYNRQGQSAAKQTLNNLNAANMGRNSSYSSAATAQVQQAYAQKASEMIPTLAEQAYNKLLQQYGIEKDIADTEYNRQLTAYQTLADDYTRGLTDKGLALSNEKDELDLKYYEDMLRNQVAMGEISLADAELLLRQQMVQTQIAEEYGMRDSGYNSEILRKSSLGYGTSGGGGSGGGSSSASKQEQRAYGDRKISEFLYSPKNADGTGYWNYMNENTNPIYAAVDKLKDPQERINIVDSLMAFGYGYDEAKKKLDEYETNVTIQTMKIEGKDWEDEDYITERKNYLFGKAR